LLKGVRESGKGGLDNEGRDGDGKPGDRRDRGLRSSVNGGRSVT